MERAKLLLANCMHYQGQVLTHQIRHIRHIKLNLQNVRNHVQYFTLKNVKESSVLDNKNCEQIDYFPRKGVGVGTPPAHFEDSESFVVCCMLFYVHRVRSFQINFLQWEQK